MSPHGALRHHHFFSSSAQYSLRCLPSPGPQDFERPELIPSSFNFVAKLLVGFSLIISVPKPRWYRSMDMYIFYGVLDRLFRRHAIFYTYSLRLLEPEIA